MGTRSPSHQRQGNRRVGAIVALSALAMIGAAYAAVPLYAAFCKATGFAGTTQVATANSGVKGERTLTVRFDANVAPGLDWSFEPEVDSVRLRTGLAMGGSGGARAAIIPAALRFR